MAFPFPHIKDKEIFKGTFINEVSFKLYLPIDDEFVSLEKASVLFKKVFNLNFDEFEYGRLKSSRLKVGNTKAGIMFEFSSKSIKISISQIGYKSFSSSLLPLINKLVDAYSDWYEYCENVELKYIDVWPLADQKNLSRTEMKSLENALFSTNMRSKAKTSDTNFKYLECDDDKFLLVIEYGNFIPEEESQNSGIALQTKCSCIKPKIICKDIPKIAVKQNEILYDAFRWAVTSDVINAMRNLNI